MSYCDTCIHHYVCGAEGIDDEAMTYCADRIEPCEDAISRQVAISNIRGMAYHRGYTLKSDDVIKMLKEMENVIPKQRTGHWIDTDSDDACWYMCSRCHRRTDEKSDYCPNCGFRMVEPQESEE